MTAHNPARPPDPTPSGAYPPCVSPLEEATPAGPRDAAAALAFALSRLPAGDPRPVLFAAPRTWVAEYGRPFARGLAGRLDGGLLLALPRTAAETLWALEQALRSGAVAGAVGAPGEITLTAGRRLAFAAREGQAAAVLLRPTAGGPSAAGRRWRVAAAAGTAHPFDARAPGPARLRAELTRRRDGPPGAWWLEQDDETGRFRLADGLAGDGLVAHGRTRAAA